MSHVCYRINAPNVVSQTIDRETIIINFDSGVYYSANETGAAIWTLIENGATADGIIEDLKASYLPDGVSIEQSVAEFIEHLANEGLVAVSDGGLETDAAASEPSGERTSFAAPVLERYNDMAELLLLDPVHEIEDRRQSGRNSAP